MLVMPMMLLPLPRARPDRHPAVAASVRSVHPDPRAPQEGTDARVPPEDPATPDRPAETVPCCPVLLPNRLARSARPVLPDPKDLLDPRDCPDPREILESPERMVFRVCLDLPDPRDLRVRPETLERRERLESPERLSTVLLPVPLDLQDSPDPKVLPVLLARMVNPERLDLLVLLETLERREPMDCPDPMDLLDPVDPLVSEID